MGWIRRLFGLDGSADACVLDVANAAAEVQIRELALCTCINLIASAVGRCDFQTFEQFQSVRNTETYLWNVEPNVNENSTAFFHRLIDKLCRENEVLVVPTAHRDGRVLMNVADSWDKPSRYPQKMQEYKNVRVGEVAYTKTFRENEVLHLTLHHTNAGNVVKLLWESYSRLFSAASSAYTWSQGRHLKVKVSQIAQGTANFQENFQKMMTEEVGKFLKSENGVLPEFSGYEYSDIGGSSNTERSTRDIRKLIDDIFDFTAMSLDIPPVLLHGQVEGIKEAVQHWMTTGICPITDQLEEEINRKRYGYELWQQGTYLHIDTSTVSHLDLFANACNIEKLIGSGAYSINDVLRASGQPEIDAEWARVHWLTLNIGNIEAAARMMPNNEKGGSK